MIERAKGMLIQWTEEEWYKSSTEEEAEEVDMLS